MARTRKLEPAWSIVGSAFPRRRDGPVCGTCGEEKQCGAVTKTAEGVQMCVGIFGHLFRDHSNSNSNSKIRNHLSVLNLLNSK